MKTIKEIDIKNKKVLLRVDYNVPIQNGQIIDDNRILESINTINYLIENKCTIIILSHLGKVKSEEDIKINSLYPVKERLQELLNKDVRFIKDFKKNTIEHVQKTLLDGEIILFENTRIMDYPNMLESKNNVEFAKRIAKLADCFVMDAFGSSHRAHASTVGITKIIPSYAGLLVEKEINELDKIINEKKILILGGSKVSSKIGVIKNLLNKSEYICIGGAMCATFLKANNINIGKTYVEDNYIEEVKDMLKSCGNKIILPIDVITENGEKKVEDIEENEHIYDIGNKTIELFLSYIEKKSSVLINGTMGMYEDTKYENGTKQILKYLYQNQIKTILCGGDSGAAAKKYNLKFYYTSTGGGASLEYLSGKNLPGLENLK